MLYIQIFRYIHIYVGSYIYIYTHNFVYNYIPGIYLFLWMDKKERYPSELWIEMTEIRETGAYWRRTGWKLVEKKRRQPDARAPWWVMDLRFHSPNSYKSHCPNSTYLGSSPLPFLVILSWWSVCSSGCKNPLPLSLNSDPLFVIICTQSLQSSVVAQRCP